MTCGYWPTLENSFHFDDMANIVRAYPLHLSTISVEGLQRALAGATIPGRLLPNLTFVLDWWRGAGDPAPFQVTNLILHLLNVAVLFLLLSLLLRRLYPNVPLRWWLGAVWLAAAIWALHPIQTQAVTYIVQRMAEMAALFMLLSCYSYLRGRLTCGGARWGWLAAAGAAALAAGISKESGWVMPALWWLMEYGVVRHGQPLVQVRLDRWLLGLPLVAVAVVAVDLWLAGPLTAPLLVGYEGRDFTLTERLLTQPRVILFHISQILWPLPQRFSIFHDPELSTALWSPATTGLALLVVVGWIGVGLWALLQLRLRLIGALLLWLPTTLVIESSFVPLEMVFEHRMYLPSVGLAALLGVLLLRVVRAGNRNRWLVWGGAMVLLPLLMVATVERLSHWRDPLTLYQSAINTVPNNVRANFNLANTLQQRGDHQQAINYYARVVALDPVNGDAYNNMAHSYQQLGQLQQARASFVQALAVAPNNYHSLGGLALLERTAGQVDAAVLLLQQAIAIAPYREDAYIHLSQLYREQQQWPVAQQLLEQGIADSNGNPMLHNELGLLFMQRRQLPLARAEFERAIATYPGYGAAYSNLGGVLVELGELAAGRLMLQRALRLEPGLTQAQQNLRAVEEYLQGQGN